jgi:hypothetical protein
VCKFLYTHNPSCTLLSLSLFLFHAGVKARSSLYLGPTAAAAVKAGDDILALIGSLPRTLRTLQWAVQAAVGYKRLMMSLAPDLDPEGYNAQISNLHNYWAQVRHE